MRRLPHKDTDPRNFEAVRLVALTGIDFSAAAEAVFGDKGRASDVEYWFYYATRNSSRDRKTPRPATWIGVPAGRLRYGLQNESGGYQTCAVCKRVIADPKDKEKDDDVLAYAVQIVAGRHREDGLRGKPVVGYMCLDCAGKSKTCWPGAWKQMLVADRMNLRFDGNWVPGGLLANLLKSPPPDPAWGGICTQCNKPVELCGYRYRVPVFLPLDFGRLVDSTLFLFRAHESERLILGRSRQIVSWGRSDVYEAHAGRVEFEPTDEHGNNIELTNSDLDCESLRTISGGRHTPSGLEGDKWPVRPAVAAYEGDWKQPPTPESEEKTWAGAGRRRGTFLLGRNFVEEGFIEAYARAEVGGGLFPGELARVAGDEVAKYRPIRKYIAAQWAFLLLEARDAMPAVAYWQDDRTVRYGEKPRRKKRGAYRVSIARTAPRRSRGHDFVCDVDAMGRSGWLPAYSAKKAWGPPIFGKLTPEILPQNAADIQWLFAEWFRDHNVANELTFERPGRPLPGERKVKNLQKEVGRICRDVARGMADYPGAPWLTPASPKESKEGPPRVGYGNSFGGVACSPVRRMFINCPRCLVTITEARPGSTLRTTYTCCRSCAPLLARKLVMAKAAAVPIPHRGSPKHKEAA